MGKTIQCPHGCGPMTVTNNSKNRPIAKCPKCGQTIFNLKGYKPDGDGDGDSKPGSGAAPNHDGGGQPQAKTKVSQKKKAGRQPAAPRPEPRSESKPGGGERSAGGDDGDEFNPFDLV